MGLNLNKLFLLLSAVFLFACDPEAGRTTPDLIVEAYRPVYGHLSQSSISIKSARPIKNPGKIYVYQHYLLINEKQAGIHIVDNSNAAQPQQLGFIEILGNSDMAIKDDILFADHLGSLVALKSNQFTSIEELGKLPLNNWLLGVPPPSGSYFECVDQSKGIVIAWQKVTVKNPDCYAF